MKTLLALCTLLVLALPALADSTIRIVGTPKWRITPPLCTFTVNGPIQNLSPAGTTSGTLRLVLYMSPNPFPSPGAVAVSQHTLGQLGGQFQIDRVKAKEPASVPDVTGNYFFTVAVIEYTAAGWRTRAFAEAGRRKLKNGVFVAGKQWKIPKDTVLPPPVKMRNKTLFKFKTKATEQLDRIASDSQTKTEVKIRRAKNCRYQSIVGKTKAKYKYKAGRGKVQGKRVDVGKLTVDFASTFGTFNQTESRFVLYYTAAGSGYYKRTDIAGADRQVTWGLFTME